MEEQKGGNFVLRNWSYYELQKMIEGKAKRKGIEVKYIDAYHTSQTCAVCDNYEKGQRDSKKDQSKFFCKNNECSNFEKEINADYNAALNIAKSNNYLNPSKATPKDTLYYKNKKQKEKEK